jgi:hypothetical protein
MGVEETLALTPYQLLSMQEGLNILLKEEFGSEGDDEGTGTVPKSADLSLDLNEEMFAARIRAYKKINGTDKVKMGELFGRKPRQQK